jgi:hypothetical protein
MEADEDVAENESSQEAAYDRPDGIGIAGGGIEAIWGILG